MLIDLINQRKRYFAAQKAKAKRNKPMTQAQQRNYMMNYIKHMGSHTLQQLKRYSFDELKELFETTMKNVNTFVPMETEDRGRAPELAAGSLQATITDSAEVKSSKRGAEVELDHEGSKKQKTNEASESVQEQPDEEEKELPQEHLQQTMMVVPMEEVNVEALQTLGDRMTLQETVWMVEEEAYASREAWAHSIRLSQATHQELQTIVIMCIHMRPISRHTRHSYSCRAQMVETLRVIRDIKREMSDMPARSFSTKARAAEES
ncbi:hypothetical protein Tco_1045492 [Tanacetum coccineum]|uniref:Uncharacterized protein n=1 Tax=Tanacetum coccineum TaxID=301880 RepID=A0ABQ5GT07_9ASTR